MQFDDSTKLGRALNNYAFKEHQEELKRQMTELQMKKIQDKHKTRTNIDDLSPDANRVDRTAEEHMAVAISLATEIDNAEIKSGIKFDYNKPSFSLFPQGVLMEILEVMQYGAKKYAPDNWMHVPNADTRYLDAAMRHILAWQSGEKTDSETGKNHLAHAMCCLSYLVWFDQQESKDGQSTPQD